MADEKVNLNIALVQQKIREIMPGVEDVIPLKLENENSQVFELSKGNEHFIARVSSDVEGVKLDKYASENLMNDEIPIPECIALNSYDENHVIIVTRKAPGVTHDKLPKKRKHESLNSIYKTLQAIHRVDISNTEGFGRCKSTGNAERSSVQDDQEQELDRVMKGLSGQSLDNSTWRRLKKVEQKLRSQVKNLPNIRHLVHGDYGYNNVVIYNNEVSAVLDWELMRYGDWVFDIMWLEFWVDGLYPGLREQWREAGFDMHEYDARYNFYKHMNILGGIKFELFRGREYRIDFYLDKLKEK